MTRGTVGVPAEIEIILVEDNPDDVKLAMHAFRKNHLSEHLRVLRDGEEALDYLFRRGPFADEPWTKRPRLVLLDLKLPKVDGFEVLRRIKTDARTRHLPVVALTSSREERDILASYTLGVNSYIVKPVELDRFVQVVRDLGCYWLLLNEPPIGAGPAR